MRLREKLRSRDAGMKLGKRPAVIDGRTLKFASYLPKPELPEVPSVVNWGKAVKRWGLHKNDRIGDCAIVGPANMERCWSFNSPAPDFEATDDQVIADYSAVSGYNPQTGENDNGCIMLDVLKRWRNDGICGHKIGAFVSVNPKNMEHVRLANWMVGGLYIGVELPANAQGARSWRYVPGTGSEAGSWGGHAVNCISHSPKGLSVVTWGEVKPMTLAFWREYVSECYAVLSSQWVETGYNAPNGFDLESLRRDLEMVVRRERAEGDCTPATC